MITIRPAIANDAQTLTGLMHASTAYRGGYASILAGYAITPAQIEKDVFHVAQQDGALCGFYSLTFEGGAELDLMFVAETVQGSGIGLGLFTHMTDEAKRRGVQAVKIVSHPPSVGFYQAMGAIVTGTAAPTVKATWSRPILSLTI